MCTVAMTRSCLVYYTLSRGAGSALRARTVLQASQDSWRRIPVKPCACQPSRAVHGRARRQSAVEIVRGTPSCWVRRADGTGLSAVSGMLTIVTTAADTLSVRDRMRLRMADENRGAWLQRAGRIRHELGESETEMWMHVHRLLEDPAAVAAMPQTVGRLRRKREAQRAVRSMRVRVGHRVGQ